MILIPRCLQRGGFISDPGNKVALNIQAIVPVDITTLQIIEKDLTGDDLIGTINLQRFSIKHATQILS